MTEDLNTFRAAGFSDAEIQSYVAGKKLEMKQAGASDQEINTYFVDRAPGVTPGFVSRAVRGTKLDPTSEPGLLGEIYNGAARHGISLVYDLEALGAKIRQLTGDEKPDEAAVAADRNKRRAEAMGHYESVAPTLGDISSTRTAAHYVAGKVGEIIPMVGEYLALGIPRMVVWGAVGGALHAGEQNEWDPAATSTGAAIGAAAAGAPAPFLKGAVGKGFIENVSRGILGMSAVGAAQTAAEPAPKVAKKISEGGEDIKAPGGVVEEYWRNMPTAEQFAEGIASSAIGGALLGGVGGLRRRGTAPDGSIKEEVIGGMPASEDFANAARTLAGETPAPGVHDKLARLWSEYGVHPSEAALDALNDPITKQELMSVNPDLPSRYTGMAPPEGRDLVPAEGAGGPPAVPPEPPGGRAELPPPAGLPAVREDQLPSTEVREPGEPAKPMTPQEAKEKLLSHMSIGERDPTRGLSFSRLYTYFVDALNPIKKITKELAPEGLPAEQDPYAWFRALTGVASKAHSMLMGAGVTAFNNPARKIADSMREIMAPVRDDLDGFRAFAAAARAIELDRRGIDTGFDLEAARTWIKDNPQYDDVLAKLIDFRNKAGARQLLDSGIISRAQHDAMLDKNLMFVPFYRLLDPQLRAQTGGGTLMPTSPLHKIMGSERVVIDPLESIIKDTYLFTQMAERNRAAVALVDLMDKANLAPIVERGMIPTTAPRDAADFAAWMEHYGAPKGVADELAVLIQSVARDVEETGNTIALYRNGKREVRDVGEDIAYAVRGLDKEIVNKAVKFLGNFTNLLRAGSTLVPEFGARHLMRDYEYALVTSEGGFSPTRMVRGVLHQLLANYPKTSEKLLGVSEIYNQWVQSGAANVTAMAFDRQYLQEDLRKLTAETGLMSRAWNVVASKQLSVGEKASLGFQAAIHPLQAITEIAQSASHVAAFEKALGQGKTMHQAAWESRETAVDISRRGAKMQQANLIVAFMNATIQDTDRWIRALDPRNPKQAGQAMAKIMLGITLPSIVLWAYNHDDPTYQEVPRWQKDLFWVVPTGGPTDPILRFPKPWGMGLMFGSLVERMLESVKDQNPDAFKGFAESIWEMNIPGMVPSVSIPMFEQWANKSMFTGRTLVPASLEGQLPEYQYANYTTETAKELAHLIGHIKPGGISPMILENYLAGWTGRLGQYALELSDKMLREAGMVKDPDKPEGTLADMPFVKAFVIRHPTGSAQSIQDFQEEYLWRKRVYDTWFTQLKQGDLEAAERIREIGGLEMFIKMEGIHKVIGTQTEMIRNFERMPKSVLPAREKRQLIDNTYGQMVDIAHTGMQIMRQTRNKANSGVMAPSR